MTATPSTMFPLGTVAPPFDLPDVEGRRVSIERFGGSGALLVVFMCNHCPYVKHVRGHLVGLIRDYQQKGAAAVGINANDVSAYPEDSPENMSREARLFGYTFPYLFDETQEVAKAYHAACTPDFFVFDADRALVYRGQMDDSRPGNGKPVTGADLRAALDAALQGHPAPAYQRPSIGCNIKWKPNNAPGYAGGQTPAGDRSSGI
jgi:peroxiredoxin